MEPVQARQRSEFRTVTAPAREIITQPIIYRTTVNNTERVRFHRGPDRTVSQPAVTNRPVYQERTRTQLVRKPAKEIFN